ncbi:hypothetical protein [Paenibacillus amylolyticus]|uniref:hypothetical protein n=1 Tax=Paenibacillus amylolyticus TaxID=1451 RepID=UPI00344D97A2
MEKGISNIETIAANFKEMPLGNERFEKAVAGIFLCIELEKSVMPTGSRVSSKDMEEEIIKAGFSIINTIHSPTQVANQPVYIITAQKNK